MTKIITSLEKINLVKADFFDKIDKVVNSLTVKFPKQIGGSLQDVKIFFQQFLSIADKHPWLIPSLTVTLVVLVLAWLHYLSTLDRFVQLPRRRHFKLPRYLAKLRDSFRRKKYKF